MRPNPADPDYHIRLLMGENRRLRNTLASYQSDSHSPGTPIDGSTESFTLDPLNPHICIYTSSAPLDPLAHSVSIPISSLLVPDPANPGVAQATLSV